MKFSGFYSDNSCTPPLPSFAHTHLYASLASCWPNCLFSVEDKLNDWNNLNRRHLFKFFKIFKSVRSYRDIHSDSNVRQARSPL